MMVTYINTAGAPETHEVSEAKTTGDGMIVMTIEKGETVCRPAGAIIDVER